MKKIALLALSSLRHSDKLIDVFIAEHHNFEKIYVAFIIERHLSEEILFKLSDVGFIGPQPSDNLKKILLQEYQQQADEILKNILEKLSKSGINFEIIKREGSFAEEILKISNEKKIDIIYLSRAKRTSFSRLILGSEVDEILKKSSCEVVVIQ